jgi:hypothetical protein
VSLNFKCGLLGVLALATTAAVVALALSVASGPPPAHAQQPKAAAPPAVPEFQGRGEAEAFGERTEISTKAGRPRG